MPYPRAHLLVSWLGDAYSQQEEWQVGLRLDGTELPTIEQMEELDEAFATLVSSQGTGLPGGRRYIGLKVAPIGTNGRYPPDENAVEYLRPSPIPGSTTGGYPQIALVLSMRTARTRGYASNGRMYLPTAETPSDSSGLITLSTADSAALNGAVFIGAVNAVGLGAASVMSTVGAGLIEPITAVRVGRVIDTQRRRRNQLPESYSAASPVPL
uniref:Uncharacterized protein n=1 Tax=uncultured prokaryote TaxID=198431 RepID=A0A0H5Q3Z9_9ZZZZ|nr:hypothetical protein [uncultured prokaryote]